MALQDEPPFLEKLVKALPISWHDWLRDIRENVNLKLEVLNIFGTENQVIVTATENEDGTQKITLSTPQDIDTEANLVVGSLYIGDPNTDGSWWLTPSGSSLNVERRESSAWVKKGAFRP